jgi:hypothetical protein
MSAFSTDPHVLLHQVELGVPNSNLASEPEGCVLAARQSTPKRQDNQLSKLAVSFALAIAFVLCVAVGVCTLKADSPSSGELVFLSPELPAMRRLETSALDDVNSDANRSAIAVVSTPNSSSEVAESLASGFADAAVPSSHNSIVPRVLQQSFTCKEKEVRRKSQCDEDREIAYTITRGSNKDKTFCWPIFAYQKGTIPIVISVPHDGHERPPFMKTRHACLPGGSRNRDKCEHGKACLDGRGKKRSGWRHSDDNDGVKRICALPRGDKNTFKIAKELQAAIQSKVRGNGKPHIIKACLHRSKMDANRDLERGAQDYKYAKRAWHLYHQQLQNIRAAIEKQCVRGLWLDIHGYDETKLSEGKTGRPMRFTQLGYNSFFSNLGGSRGAQQTSIMRLAKELPKCRHLIMGKKSLGELVTREFHANDRRSFEGVVPSRDFKDSDLKTKYLAAKVDGFTVGSIGGTGSAGPDSVGVAAVQVEVPLYVRDSQGLYKQWATLFAGGLVNFMNLNYGRFWQDTCCKTSSGRYPRYSRSVSRGCSKDECQASISVQRCANQPTAWRRTKTWMRTRNQQCR